MESVGRQEVRQQLALASLSARARKEGEGNGQAGECSATQTNEPSSSSRREQRMRRDTEVDPENNSISGGGETAARMSDSQSQDEGQLGGEASQESSGVEQEKIWARKEKRHLRRAKKRRRDNGDDDDEEDNFVEAKVPVNLLELLSLLAVSLKLSVRQQLTIVMAVYILCGIDPCEMQLSLSSALRYRHRATRGIAEDRLTEVAQKVIDSKAKILIHYDTKIIEEDLEGEVQKIERLVVAISSSALEREVLLCAFPLESGTGDRGAYSPLEFHFFRSGKWEY